MFLHDGMFQVAGPLDSGSATGIQGLDYFSTNTSSPFSTLRSLTLLGNFS